MKALVRHLATMWTCVLLPASALAAADDSLSIQRSWSTEVDVVSRYVWRGLTYSEGTVVQPSITLTLGSTDFGLWANFDPSAGVGRFDEVDYSVVGSLDLGAIEARPSLMIYSYPQTLAASTGELQIELRRTLPGQLGAFARHAVDLFEYPGASFTTLGFEWEWSHPRDASLSITAQLGRGSQRFSDAYLPDAPVMHTAGVAFRGSLPLRGGWTVSPHLDWLEVVESETRAFLPVHTPLTFGVAIGWSSPSP